MSSTFAQLQLIQKGGPFNVVQVPKPSLAAGEVLIRQKVAAFNLLDNKQLKLGVLVQQWPHVLGLEGAGVIEAVGSEVKDFQPGDEVMALQGGRAHDEHWGGAFQELVIVPAWITAKKPKNITLEEAASLPVCYNTALIAIYDVLKIPLPFMPSIVGRIPESILILGGSSATGAHAIQLLHTAYPSLPIFATSSPKHHSRLTSLGATKVFDYRSDNLVADIGREIDTILDCVGAWKEQRDIFNVLDPHQSKLFAAIWTGAEPQVPDGVNKRNVSGWALTTMAGRERVMPALTELIEKGGYMIPLPVKVVGRGLKGIPDVLNQIESVSGEKLVVTI